MSGNLLIMKQSPVVVLTTRKRGQCNMVKKSKVRIDLSTVEGRRKASKKALREKRIDATGRYISKKK